MPVSGESGVIMVAGYATTPDVVTGYAKSAARDGLEEGIPRIADAARPDSPGAFDYGE